MTDLPRVTVIVPAYNAAGEIAALIEALMGQDYPSELAEIIIVDNNSTDETFEIASKYKITVLKEDEYQSSYAARNSGLNRASGEYIAFTDADCLPEPDWLKNGITEIMNQKADLAGGQVKFYFHGRAGAAELYDSLTNMDNKRVIENRQVAKTANLFVRSDVFGKAGPFPGNVKSGGDVQWTKRATDMGFKIVYIEQAVVKHPARKLGELVKKQRRVARGQYEILKGQGYDRLKIFCEGLVYFKPSSFNKIKKLVKSRYENSGTGRIISIWITAWILRVINGWVLLRCIFSNKNNKDNIAI
jgi:glycosyltransferase involved in cell wall biosynthesis